MSVWRRALRLNVRLSYWLVLVLLLLIAAYVSFGRLASPLLAEHKAQVELLLSQQLRLPVQLGHLEADWIGFSPVVRAAQVTIGQGEHKLAVQQLYFQPDLLSSLLTWQWQLGAVSLEGLQLTVKQDRRGAWSLLGMSLTQADESPATSTASDALRQVRRLGRLSVLEAQVHVQPYAVKPFSLARTNIVVSNQSGRQQVQANLTLPDQQTVELSVSGIELGSSWREASAEFYLQTPTSDWMQWLPKNWLPTSVASLTFGGEFWLTLKQGFFTQGVFALQQAHLAAEYQGRDALVRLGEARGYFNGDQQRRTLWFEQLPIGFSHDEPLFNWPLQLSQHKLKPESRFGVFELRAQRLDLQPMNELLLAHLDSAIARDVLGALAFKGQLANTYVRWQPEANWADQLQFDTNLDAVEFSPWRAVPGATGVSGRLAGDLQQGELRLDSDGFSLNLAEFFSQAWPYAKANAQLTWSFDDEGFWLKSPYLQVQGDEGEIAGDFVIRLLKDPAAEDYMDLRVGMRDGDARYTQRYLPKVLAQEQPQLKQWLVQAIEQGDVKEGYFQYQGSLNAGAPNHARSITLFFDVEQTGFAYQPQWPALSEGRAQVFIHDWGVQVELDQAKVLNSVITQAHAQVVYAAEGAVTALEVEAQLQSNVADGLYLVQSTPLAQQAPALQDWRGEGAVPAEFKLRVPFAPQPVHAQVSMQLDNAHLQMPELAIELEQLSGELEFSSDKGVTAPQLKGRFLQQPFAASIAAKDLGATTVTQVQAYGKMPVTALHGWLGVAQEQPWRGAFAYQLFVTLDGEDSQLVVESDLQGVTLELPVPLAKAAEQKRPTRWQMTLAGRERHYWLRHGSLFNAFAAQTTASKHVRAELRLGAQPARLPVDSGVVIRGHLEQLELAQWLALAQRYQSRSAASGSATAEVTQIDLSADRVTGLAMPIENAQITYAAGQAKGQWQAQLTSQQLKGELYQETEQAPIQVAIEHLYLPGFAEHTLDSFGQQLGQTPARIPAMQINIEQLYADEQLLGRWALQTQPYAQGVRFTELDLELKGLHVAGELDWRQDPEHSSHFTGELTGADIAQVLKAWQFSPSMTSERFKAELTLHWPSSPLAVTLADLEGGMYLSFRKGQLKTGDSGSKALRVFGLLNFDTVGRRLRLDFSDLLGKGLAYDTFKGRFLIQQGVYQTQGPFALKGVSSELEFEGALDLKKGQVDATLLVAMPITSNLPLAAVLVGAPAVGGALFIMERFVGDRLDRMAAVSYHITGDWQEPNISLIDKRK